MLANKYLCLTDATCYDSHLRYPADVKLLWESCAWLHTLVMEGSFGNQKQHYGVGRIAARNQFSETLLLFFGIHMANAATLAARELAKEETLKKGTQPNNVLHILFYIPTNGRNELLCPNVKNSWPSGLPRMQSSDSVPIFDAFIAISHQMAF